MPMLAALVLAAAARSACAGYDLDPAKLRKSGYVIVSIDGIAIEPKMLMGHLINDHGEEEIDHLVDRRLIQAQADRLHIAADQKEVAARFQAILQGFPSRAALDERLSDVGSSSSRLEDSLREEVLREQVEIKALDLSVTDLEVRDYFERNKDRLGTPEAVHLGQLTAATQREAEGFLAALRAGADFGRLARQVSIDRATAAKDGEVGWIPRGQLRPDLEKVIFALQPRQASQPVQGPLGWTIFYAAGFRPAKPAKLEDVKEQVRRTLMAAKVAAAFPAFILGLRRQAHAVPPLPPRDAWLESLAR